MNYIQRAWESYLREVVPVDAPATQLTESKRAFFAGALSCFAVYVDCADISDDDGVARLDALLAEFDEYRRTLRLEARAAATERPAAADTTAGPERKDEQS